MCAQRKGDDMYNGSGAEVLTKEMPINPALPTLITLSTYIFSIQQRRPRKE
jgi:hypothetical protein